MLRLFAGCGRLRSGSQPITDVSHGMPSTALMGWAFLTGSRGLTRCLLVGSAPPSSSSTTAANGGERVAGKGRAL